jgi:lipid A 3-O-deacylase
VPAAFFCARCGSSAGTESFLGRLNFLFAGTVVWAVMAGAAVAQSGAPVTIAVTNPVRQTLRPLNIGVLTQAGFGVTENRGGFKFFMVGVRAGKVLTPMRGYGLLRGNFELGAEVFPFWQSYTPTMLRQNCVYVANPVLPGAQQASCSTPFSVGGTFTGVSITPVILRWNLAGTRRISPWVQGAGGLLWTNHKYPAFGGPPATAGGLSNTSFGNNGLNAETSVWNFTPQFGVGAHYFVNAKRSIDIGANAIHISSASLGDKNPGVNASVQFTVGYSWWK